MKKKWVDFFLNGRIILSYSYKEESEDERQATKELLSADHGCTPEEIETFVEDTNVRDIRLHEYSLPKEKRKYRIYEELANNSARRNQILVTISLDEAIRVASMGERRRFVVNSENEFIYENLRKGA